MRTTPGGIQYLHEDNDHGINANIGIYELKNRGDKNFYSFWQDPKKIKQKIDRKVDHKEREKISKGLTANRQQILIQIWK